jgi:Fungal protein kinase
MATDSDRNVDRPSSSSFSFISAGTSESGSRFNYTLGKKCTGTESQSSQYQHRAQSSRFCDDKESYNVQEINKLLAQDLIGRKTLVGESIAGILFPDTAFGFPVNDQFIHNFVDLFLTGAGILPCGNFGSEKTTCIFLNRIIATITNFLHATGEPSLQHFKPLRYFTSIQSNTPIEGSGMKRKPDIMLVRLIDGRVREGALAWHDLQALIEHTKESKAPTRMRDTVITKTYLTFCFQPERDFLISLSILRESFIIVVMDHSGAVETGVLPFNYPNTMVFIRVVMGMAFLPDSYIGVDMSIIRREVGVQPGKKFSEIHQPYPLKAACNPSIILLSCLPCHLSDTNPLAITATPAPEGFDTNISTVSIGTQVYPVYKVIFEAKTLIGRATKVFLVKLPDGKTGVLKDSWIAVNRISEASFLNGLVTPFGPELITNCILRKTSFLRQQVFEAPAVNECREKRRIVTYPAGVHIANFTSLWELIIAFLDIVISTYQIPRFLP